MLIPNRYLKLGIKTKQGTTNFVYENSMGEGPRMEFSIMKYANSGGSGLNTAQIKIYNLSDESFKLMTNTANQASLVGGYIDKNNIIFKGNVLTVLRKRQMTDIITTLYCSTNFDDQDATKIVNVSVTSQTLNDFLRAIATKIGVTLDSRLDDNILISDRAFFAPVGVVLNDLSLTYEFKWFIDMDTLKIVKYGSTPTKLYKYTPANGLIRSPMVTEKGVDIDIMLDCFIQPGDTFELDSKFADYNLAGMEFVERVRGSNFANQSIPDKSRYQGRFNVLHLTHEGSTHTNSWYTHLEGNRIEN